MSYELFRDCIAACNACADACDHCTAACLGEDAPEYLTRCVVLDVDCAAICRVAAGFMARGSELADAVCVSCALVCERCAEECEQHAHMDHCRVCADACRRCAEQCRRMAADHGTQRMAMQSA
jgi:tetrahydromethanopterin S-methyltransferase subunit C